MRGIIKRYLDLQELFLTHVSPLKTQETGLLQIQCGEIYSLF